MILEEKLGDLLAVDRPLSALDSALADLFRTHIALRDKMIDVLTTVAGTQLDRPQVARIGEQLQDAWNALNLQ